MQCDRIGCSYHITVVSEHLSACMVMLSDVEKIMGIIGINSGMYTSKETNAAPWLHFTWSYRD